MPNTTESTIMLMDSIINELNAYINNNKGKVADENNKRRLDVVVIAESIYTYFSSEVNLNTLFSKTNLTRETPNKLPTSNQLKINIIFYTAPERFRSAIEKITNVLENLKTGLFNNSELKNRINSVLTQVNYHVLTDVLVKERNEKRLADNQLAQQNNEYNTVHVNLFKIPTDILKNVFSFFSVEMLTKLNRVSKKFNELANDNVFWKKEMNRVFTEQFNMVNDGEITFKKAFVQNKLIAKCFVPFPLPINGSQADFVEQFSQYIKKANEDNINKQRLVYFKSNASDFKNAIFATKYAWSRPRDTKLLVVGFSVEQSRLNSFISAENMQEVLRYLCIIYCSSDNQGYKVKFDGEQLQKVEPVEVKCIDHKWQIVEPINHNLPLKPSPRP